MLFADGEAQNRVALKDVKSISFKADVEAGISAVATDGDVSIEPGRVILGNLAAGSRIAVVALDGRTVLSAVAEGSYTISLDTLEAGVYVISYNKRSLKIAVK